jgi:hypothetical protein
MMPLFIVGKLILSKSGMCRFFQLVVFDKRTWTQEYIVSMFMMYDVCTVVGRHYSLLNVFVGKSKLLTAKEVFNLQNDFYTMKFPFL